jgi:hypothetical protein
MERCENCKHWRQDILNKYGDFGNYGCQRFACYEDMPTYTTVESIHILCSDPLIKTNKEFGCIDFESKAWSLK